jgi:hypothetical protein
MYEYLRLYCVSKKIKNMRNKYHKRDSQSPKLIKLYETKITINAASQ